MSKIKTKEKTNLKEILKDCNVSFSEIKENHSLVYQKIYDEEKNWLNNLEDKTDKLPENNREDIDYVISKIKDTALRRRFSFEEVAPNPDLIKEMGLVIDGIDLAELLTTLNDRIEKLLDRDHLIGHSYFLKLTTVAELKTVFYKNIIPLLQEHFFGDYGKIGLVLGEGFVQEKVSKSIFAKFSSYESRGLEERQIYQIHDYRKGDLIKGEQSMNFKQAIILLLATS